jgi:hypothetical protein
MTAFIQAVMYMKCVHKGEGGIATQAGIEIGELVRNTHNVHPHTRKTIGQM